MKKKHRKIALLAKSKVKTIKKLCKTLMVNEISHVDFTKIINKAGNYCKLTENRWLMKCERVDKERVKNSKKRQIDEIIKQREKKVVV